MNDHLKSKCSNCGGRVREKLVNREFTKEGTTVVVKGVRAIVCSRCGEVFFSPNAASALLNAANALFELARQNRQHKGAVIGVARS